MTEVPAQIPTRDQVVTALTVSLLPLAQGRAMDQIDFSDLRTLLRAFVEAESAGDPRAASKCLVDVLEQTLAFSSVLSFDFVPWILAVIQDFSPEVSAASLPVLEARLGIAFDRDAAQDRYYQQVLSEAERSGIVCRGLMGPTGTVQPSRGGAVRVVETLKSGFGARLQQFSG